MVFVVTARRRLQILFTVDNHFEEEWGCVMVGGMEKDTHVTTRNVFIVDGASCGGARLGFCQPRVPIVFDSGVEESGSHTHWM
jgi:hypothetical protein